MKGGERVEVFKLFGSIFVDNEKANKSIDDTDKKAQGLGGKISGMIGTAAKWGAGLAAGGAVALGGMAALATKTAAAADEIDKLSERTGINREELQRWKYAAGQSGADISKLEVGIKTLSDQMDMAVSGNEKAAEGFAKLGISIDDLKNKSQEDIFEQVMASLGDMEQGAARNALGNDLLGRSYTELLPLLNAGSGGMQELKDRADSLGLVMSEDAVKANVKFGDTMDDLKQSFGAVFMHISNAVLPVLQQLIDWVLLHMPQIQATFQTVFDVIRPLIEGFIGVIQNVIQWVTTWAQDNEAQAEKIKELFTKLFDAVKGLITAFVGVATVIWKQYGDSIMSVIKFAFDIVSTTIDTALNLITDIFNIFSALFRGDWEALWGGVKQFFLDIWDGIYGGLKATINLIIRAVNGMIDGLNKLRWDIPAWVPVLGGKSWGFSLPHIPELARGGDLLEDGLVKIGELGPELLQLPKGARVSPLSGGGGAQSLFGRGAFEGVIIMDDYGVDRLMDRIDERMAAMGVR
jgi:hypothetical protein